MDINELKERVVVEQATREALSELMVEEVEAEICDAGDTAFYYDESDVINAVDMLKKCHRTLAFFGDKEVSGMIVKKDRERMFALGQEVEKFLAALYTPPDEF